MKPPQIIHRLAMMSLGVVGGVNTLGTLRNRYFTPWQHVLTPIIAVAIWGLLLRKLWKRPREWGLGIGLFLSLMIAFQCWLYRLALADPGLNTHGATWPPFLVFGESPIFVAGVLCILLRFRYPKAPPAT